MSIQITLKSGKKGELYKGRPVLGMVSTIKLKNNLYKTGIVNKITYVTPGYNNVYIQ